ncbi:MAG: TonB-dependent receptor [Bryobacteraceae bacterium]
MTEATILPNAGISCGTAPNNRLVALEDTVSSEADNDAHLFASFLGLPGFAICLIALVPCGSPAQTSVPHDLGNDSLEDLMNIQVTSVSKKGQALSKAPSAIFVITQDDIRHSGATTIPDLLRIVPGVDVARTTANAWAISIRGFNFRYSGKVLVLVDGRTVYTPLFSGVFWDEQNMPLETIERIEVIRGPGGTVWGANAMNGVINIITKSAAKTYGSVVSVVGGSQGTAEGLIQYGGSAGAQGSYRIFGRYTMNGNSPPLVDRPAVDAAHTSQIGFRSDWKPSVHDKLTVQGDLFGTSESQTVTTLFSNRLPNYYTFDDKVRAGTGNLLGRWNHVFGKGSETTLQMYYDRSRRFDQGLATLNTSDVDFQYHFRVGTRNDIVTGLGYRLTDQSTTNGYAVSFNPDHRRDNLYSVFFQDEVKLTDSVAVTMGIKLEHNAYTGIEYEPSMQLAWSPTSRHTVWVSASKAVQQPSWVYAEAQVDAAALPLPGGGFGIYQLQGGPQAAPRVYDSELGYRTELSRRLTLDATVFVSKYDRLQTFDPQPPFFILNPAPPHLVLPSVFANFGKATNYGTEVSAHWEVAGWWRISPGLSLVRASLSQAAGGKDPAFATTAGDSPARQAQLRSNMNLAHTVEWDISAYYVGVLTTGPVPPYTRLDTRLGWHIGKAVEVSVAGQNLLTPRHLEFFDGQQVVPTQVGRGVVGRLTWRR